MWFRVDDKLPNHAKTRRVRKSHPSKRRDAAPFGLWVLAGAFSDDGFIPLEVLEDWDDDAESLADRLVLAGLWIECEQAGEPGYRFHDWAAHNPVDAATSGIYGNHKRWHVGGKKPSDECPLCISEGLVAQKPVEKAEQQELSGRVAPESPPIIAPESGGCIAPDSLPDPIRPDPTRPDPTILAGSSLLAPLAEQSAQTLIAEWLDHTPQRPPGRVIGQVSKELKAMLDEGQPYEDVRNGLSAWAQKGLHPSTLASVVHETRTPKVPRTSHRQQETDDLFAAAARRMGITPQPLHNHLTIEGTVA